MTEAPTNARARGKPRKLPDGMRLRGKVYYAWFKHKGREVRKRLSADFAVATTMLRDLRGRIERGEWGILDNDCDWKEITDQFKGFVRQTLRDADQYEADLKRFETFRKVSTIKQIDARYVVQYRQWRLAQRAGQKGNGRPITPRTVNRELGTLRNMLNKAVEWKLIAFNPLATIKPLKHDTPAKARRSLTVAEVESLFAATPDYLRPVWRMFMVTGLRKEELVDLRWSDIDFDRRCLTVRASVAKSRKSREVPLDDDMIESLSLLKAQATFREPVPGTTARKTNQQAASFSRDHVFVTKANTPWRNNLLKRFYLYAQKAGITDAVPRGAVDIHSLRVTFTTLSIEHGASPKAVQDIVGHSTLNLTMNVYTKATDRTKRAAISALPFAKASAPAHVLQVVGVVGDVEHKGDRRGTKVATAT